MVLGTDTAEKNCTVTVFYLIPEVLTFPVDSRYTKIDKYKIDSTVKPHTGKVHCQIDMEIKMKTVSVVCLLKKSL